MVLFSTMNIIGALNYLDRIINILILARVVLSWTNPNPYSSIVRFIYGVTEPILAPIRNLIYRLGYNGMIDFSPILAIFLINILFDIIIRMVIAL
ncbi:MAG: YggT family protein [Clostridiales bacterium]|nr:YggT family protein [Clostridiales bacterium]